MAIRVVGMSLESGQNGQNPVRESGSVPPGAPGATEGRKIVSREAVRRAAGEINEKLETHRVFNRQLKVRIHEDPRRIMVKVLDASTGETIREIPPEQVLEAAKIIDRLMGLLVDEKV